MNGEIEGTVLVVEDDPLLRASLAELAKEVATRVVAVDCCKEARRALREHQIDVVFTDLHLPDGTGFDVIDSLADGGARPRVIVATADREIGNAVAALHRGVSEFLLKPLDFARAEDVLRSALTDAPAHKPQLEQTAVPVQDWRSQHAASMIGDSPALLSVLDAARRVASSDCSILIHGESGTGKELLARALHSASSRRDGPFVAVNCAAIPDNLVESELFGHARGAFTGATASRVGRFAMADHGTLFLDEIGELPLAHQAKLLRAIQDHEVFPVGESRPRKVDVRVVSATHRDLEKMVDESKFREDLYYRIQVIPLTLPPLRERRDDVMRLTQAFVAKSCRARGAEPPQIAEDALEALTRYSWPGNVRQLENVIERTLLLCADGTVGLKDLPPRILDEVGANKLQAPVNTLPEEGIDLRDAVERYENALILAALERTGWNKNQAAAVLGMNRTTLVEKIKKKNLEEGAA